MKRAFTLIELLVVMVIAAVIMAVALPGFMSMSKGKAMRMALRTTHSTISLARQWAITHRGNITIRYGEYFDGIHTEDAASKLTDRSGPFQGNLTGQVLYNITTGSKGTITSNSTTTVAAGGISWTKYDRYKIGSNQIALSAYCVNDEDAGYIQKSEPLAADVAFKNDASTINFSDSIVFTSTGGLGSETNKTITIVDRHENMEPAIIFINWLTGGISVH